MVGVVLSMEWGKGDIRRTCSTDALWQIILIAWEKAGPSPGPQTRVPNPSAQRRRRPEEKG